MWAEFSLVTECSRVYTLQKPLTVLVRLTSLILNPLELHTLNIIIIEVCVGSVCSFCDLSVTLPNILNG